MVLGWLYAMSGELARGFMRSLCLGIAHPSPSSQRTPPPPPRHYVILSSCHRVIMSSPHCDNPSLVLLPECIRLCSDRYIT
ncbi:MAG: hypothetical protein MJE68_22560 [Proteobacteria bacterium]|nr:hypothetical protein [Pseudomonadota bacterium]